MNIVNVLFDRFICKYCGETIAPRKSSVYAKHLFEKHGKGISEALEAIIEG